MVLIKESFSLYKTCNENLNLDTKSLNTSIEAGQFNLDGNLRQEFSLTRHVDLLNRLELWLILLATKIQNS